MSDSQGASSTSARKRRREHETEDHESEGGDEFPDDSSTAILEACDTFLALRKLHDDFWGQNDIPGRPNNYGGGMTYVLCHHIYSVLSNRTAVDRELAGLQRENSVRLFRIHGLRADDTAVLATPQYLDAAANSSLSEPATELLRALVNKHRGLYVSGADARAAAEEVCRTAEDDEAAIASDEEGAGVSAAADAAAAGGGGGGAAAKGGVAARGATAAAPAVLSELVRAGFLLPRRDIVREDAFWFFSPGLGTLATSLRRGRSELEQAVKRRRYKEIKLSELKKIKLRQSKLPLPFLIRDLVALGVLTEVETPSGPFVKLATR